MANFVFELAAKLGLDTSEYDSGLGKARDSGASFAEKIGGAMKKAAKVGTVALTAAGTAVGALAKQSVGAYADYEQLAGGIETLFGDSAPKVMADAASAFKDAGMSMNQYMDTAIQSAAAMINSLDGDTAKASDLMNMSIVDMADNVNKMGTSMEAVQNAYRGFSRGNFTMLDNLALGFAGTKEGMQELLDKAQELSGVKYDISSYSDIVQAIHVVQEEMGITGTTAKEAAQTVSGSLSAMKSAWTNLVANLANPDADIGLLIDNMVSSAETALGNIMPVAERALKGIGQVVSNLGPALSEKLLGLLGTILPTVISVATDLIGALGQAFLDNAPTLLTAATEVITQFVSGINGGEAVQQLTTSAITLIRQFVAFLGMNAPQMVEAAVNIIIGLAEGLTDPGQLDMLVTSAIYLITRLGDALIEAIPKLIPAAVEIITGLVGAIVENAPRLLEAALPELVEAVKTLLGSLFENLGLEEQMEKISGAFDRIKEAVSPATDAIGGVIAKVQEWISSGQAMEDITSVVSDAFGLLADGIAQVADFIATVVEKGREFVDWLNEGSAGAEAFKAVIIGITAAFTAYKVVTLAIIVAQKAQAAATALVQGAQTALNVVMSANPIGLVIAGITALVAAFVLLWNNSEGFRQFWINLWDGIKSAASSAWEKLTEIFDSIKERLEAFWSEHGEQIMTALENIRSTFVETLESIKETATSVWEGIKSALETAWNAIKETAETIWNGLQEFWNTWGDTISNYFSGVWETIKQVFQTAVDAIVDIFAIFSAVFAGDWETAWEETKRFFVDLWDNITEIFSTVFDTITSTLSDLWDAVKGKAQDIWDAVQETVDSAIDYLKGLPAKALQWGKDLISNFTSGITEKWNSLKSSISGIASGIKDFLGFSEPKEGPLSNFHTFAPDMMELYAKGIRDNKDLVMSEISGLAGDVKVGLRPREMGSVGTAPIHITVQSVLDGKVIAESTMKYQRGKAIAMGV